MIPLIEKLRPLRGHAQTAFFALSTALLITPLYIRGNSFRPRAFMATFFAVAVSSVIIAKIFAIVFRRVSVGITSNGLMWPNDPDAASAEVQVPDIKRRSCRSYLEPALFGIIVILILAEFVLLSRCDRFVFSHDTFGVFAIQYFFLDHVAQTGEVPQWLPFQNTGLPAAWTELISGNFIHQILLLLPPVIRRMGFLDAFYLGFEVDVLLLATGAWLLSLRLIGMPMAAFICTISILGSCVWVKSPYFGLLLWYALPLVIYLGHRFFDTGRWLWLYAGIIVLLAQYVGTLPYFFPFQCLIVLIYFLAYFGCNRDRIKSASRLILSPKAVPAILFAAVIVFALYYLTNGNFADVVIGDRPSTHFNLTDFLTSGGPQFTAIGWLELLFRISPNFGVSLYMGMLSVILIPAGAYFAWRNGGRHVVIVAAFLICFGLGTAVSAVSYEVWPLLGFMRYIGLTAQGAAMMLTLLAGYGFRFMVDMQSHDHTGHRIITLTVILFAGAVAVIFAAWIVNAAFVESIALNISSFFRHDYLQIITIDDVSHFLRTTFVYAATLGLLLLGVIAGLRQRVGILIPSLLLLFHVIDMGAYHVREDIIWTKPLGNQAVAVIEYRPIEFPLQRRRLPDPTDPRWRLLLSMPIDHHVKFDLAKNYLLADWIEAGIIAHTWSRYTNDLLKLFPESRFDDRRYLFPASNPRARQVMGIDEDKLQVFANPWVTRSNQAANAFSSLLDRCPGPILLVNGEGVEPRASLPLGDARCPRALNVKYRVVSFDANRVDIRVDNDHGDDAWLYYADAWDDHWRASINGVSVPIYRANVAYKAVKLGKGENLVSLNYDPLVSRAAIWLAQVLAIAAIAILAYALAEAFVPKRTIALEGR
jgi:hypothetical protein